MVGGGRSSRTAGTTVTALNIATVGGRGVIMDDLGMRGGLTADPSYGTSQVSIQPSASADVPPDSPLAMPVRPNCAVSSAS